MEAQAVVVSVRSLEDEADENSKSAAVKVNLVEASNAFARGTYRIEVLQPGSLRKYQPINGYCLEEGSFQMILPEAKLRIGDALTLRIVEEWYRPEP